MTRTLDTFEERPFHPQNSLFVKIDIGSNLRTLEQEPQELSYSFEIAQSWEICKHRSLKPKSPPYCKNCHLPTFLAVLEGKLQKDRY